MPAAPSFSTIRHEIAGIPVADLARDFGTPTYVYDGAKILERVEDLRQFDAIRYAQKACSNLAILDLVRRNGVVVDAVSAGEIRRLLTQYRLADSWAPERAEKWWKRHMPEKSTAGARTELKERVLQADAHAN